MITILAIYICVKIQCFVSNWNTAAAAMATVSRVFYYIAEMANWRCQFDDDRFFLLHIFFYGDMLVFFWVLTLHKVANFYILNNSSLAVFVLWNPISVKLSDSVAWWSAIKRWITFGISHFSHFLFRVQQMQRSEFIIPTFQ